MTLRLTKEQLRLLHSMLRVNQSGEIAANYIYKTQLLLAKDPASKVLLRV
jgi:demethoxyubiquinone hydroxylase (CLK1/Coq7/Cat5 family)